MTEQTKFRYVVKYKYIRLEPINPETVNMQDTVKTTTESRIVLFYFTLEEIEKHEGAWNKLRELVSNVGIQNFEIISRDRFVVAQENGIDLYENDIVEYIKEKTDPEDIDRRKQMGLPYKQVNSRIFFYAGSFMCYIDNYGSYLELTQMSSELPILGNIHQHQKLETVVHKFENFI